MCVYCCVCDEPQFKLNIETITDLQSSTTLIPNLASHAIFFLALVLLISNVVFFSHSVLNSFSIMLTVIERVLKDGLCEEPRQVWAIPRLSLGTRQRLKLWVCRLPLSPASSYVATPSQSISMWNLACHEAWRTGTPIRRLPCHFRFSQESKMPAAQCPSQVTPSCRHSVLPRSHPAADTISCLAYLFSTRNSDSLVLRHP